MDECRPLSDGGGGGGGGGGAGPGQQLHMAANIGERTALSGAGAAWGGSAAAPSGGGVGLAWGGDAAAPSGGGAVPVLGSGAGILDYMDVYAPLDDMAGGMASHILLAASSTTCLLLFIESHVIP